MKTLQLFVGVLAVMCTSSGEEIDGSEGDSVTITCSHKWARSNRKYFCKDPCKTDMDILVDSNKKSSGRYQLMDSGKGVFTVEIARLNKTDAGKYWCGVDRALGDTYNEVILKVHDAQQISLPPNLRTCCPTTVSSPNNILTSNATFASVSLSAPARSDQTSDAKTLGWQIYLIVSVCAFILISAVWILVFSALRNKASACPILSSSQCCSRGKEFGVNDHDGNAFGNLNLVTQCCPPAPGNTEQDYESIFTATTRFPATQNIYSDH